MPSVTFMEYFVCVNNQQPLHLVIYGMLRETITAVVAKTFYYIFTPPIALLGLFL